MSPSSWPKRFIKQVIRITIEIESNRIKHFLKKSVESIRFDFIESNRIKLFFKKSVESIHFDFIESNRIKRFSESTWIKRGPGRSPRFVFVHHDGKYVKILGTKTKWKIAPQTTGNQWAEPPQTPKTAHSERGRIIMVEIYYSFHPPAVQKNRDNFMANGS